MKRLTFTRFVNAVGDAEVAIRLMRELGGRQIPRGAERAERDRAISEALDALPFREVARRFSTSVSVVQRAASREQAR